MTERMIIVDALIKVATLFIMAVLAPAVKAWIDKNKDNKEIQMVLQMADIAVKSVENDLRTADGAAKKTEALKRLAAQIESWGIKDFTLEELTHYIETSVREMWENALPGPMPVVVENTTEEPLPVENVV